MNVNGFNYICDKCGDNYHMISEYIERYNTDEWTDGEYEEYCRLLELYKRKGWIK